MRTIKLCGLVAAVTLALAACSSAPTTPAQTIYQVESDYNAAAQVILAYKALPACGTPTSPPLCSQASVIAQLKQADTVAYNAIAAAEAVARSPNAGANAATATLAAQQAVQALTAISSQLNTGAKP